MQILRLFIGLFGLLFANLLSAQTIEFSEPISVRQDKDYRLIGQYDGHTLLYRELARGYLIQAFDKNLEVAWQKSFELEHRRARPLYLVDKRDSFAIVYHYFFRGKTYVKVQNFDRQANATTVETIALFSRRENLSNRQVLFSKNKIAVLTYATTIEGRIEFEVYSLRDKTSLYRKTLEPKDLNYFRDFLQVEISDEGECFWIFERDNKRNRREQSRLVLYDISAEEVNKQIVDMKGKLRYDSYFIYDNLNAQLVGVGLYGERNLHTTNGYFYIRIPQQSDSVFMHLSPFEEAFMPQLTGQEGNRRNGVRDIDIQEVVLRRDGGALLIAERNRQYEYQSVSTFNNPGLMTPQVDYYYEDILLVSVHPDGSEHWKNVLHKSQESQDDRARFSSFFLLRSKRYLFFVYNDKIERNTSISNYAVTGLGESARETRVMKADRPFDVLLALRYGIQVSGNAMMATTEFRNQLRLGRITVEP